MSSGQVQRLRAASKGLYEELASARPDVNRLEEHLAQLAYEIAGAQAALNRVRHLPALV